MATRKRTTKNLGFTDIGDAFERLQQAVGGEILATKPPPGSFTVKEYAERIGVAESGACKALRKAAELGRVKVDRIRVGGHIIHYYSPK